MKLKTSFFKGVTLKKDILRFAPIWALYLIGMMMVLFESGYYSSYDIFARNMLANMIPSFGIVNLCYAGICANLLFGDLYNTKLCYSLHAMPYRRESWLLTHLASGMLFSLVPNCIACLYLMTRLDAYWFLALYWLLAVTLQFLFFYGIATVSAMLTGNRFAMLAVYAGFNFISMLLYATIVTIYVPMLTGVVANMTDFSRFSPTVFLFQFDYFQFTRQDRVSIDIDNHAYGHSDYFYQYDGLGDGWGYTAILALVGIAAMGVAVWLYRKRHLESAGDFVAFPRLKGVACVIMTLCVTLCMALLGEIMGSQYLLWLIVGLVIGYFGSLMLLERRLKVFRKKTLLGFAVMGITAAITLCAIGMDWFGIESWTPKASQVQSVTVANYRRNTSYYDADYYYGGSGLSVKLEDPADIEKIIQAHADILSRLHENPKEKHRVVLTYKLKSGRTVTRSYYAPASGENYKIVRSYLYNTESILGFSDPAAFAGQVEYMYCNQGEVPAAFYSQVLEALYSDAVNEAVLTGHGEYFLEYAFTDADGNSGYRALQLLNHAEKTLSLLKGPEIAMGYTDWSAFIASVREMYLDDGHATQIPKEQREGLLTALRKDIEAGTVQAGKYISGAMLLYYTFPEGDRTSGYREFYIPSSAQYTLTWLRENQIIPS